MSKSKGCCSEIKKHPDHSKQLHRINRISGQLEGVKRMILEHQYCPEIILQIQAIRAALKSLESVILGEHLEMCVKDALNSKNQKETEKKLAEIMKLFSRT